MNTRLREATEAGYKVWSEIDDVCGVAFVGRGAERPRRETLALVCGVDRPVAWLRQVHGSAVLESGPGCGGQGDALTTARRDLALAISTADCVPVVLATPGRVAAVHAGWRGIVAGVVARAVDSFAGSATPTRGWIGPAIGPCCYEVGDEVAAEVAGASGDSGVIVRPTGGAKPHLDLGRAVRSQLLSLGISQITRIERCTRCAPELHSYRRDGSTGRNLTFAWRR